MIGTDEERGLVAWRRKIQKNAETGEEEIDDCYELPYVSTWIRNQWWSAYIPILPGYKGLTYMLGKNKPSTNNSSQINHGTEENTNNTRL